MESTITAPPSDRREGLRRELTKRRCSLTVTEFQFLEDIADDGDDDAIALASERLKDEKLFFDPDAGKTKRGPKGRPGLQRFGGSVMGSIRRMECLESRRNSSTHTSMWKAASRRSLVVDLDPLDDDDEPGSTLKNEESGFKRNRIRPSMLAQSTIKSISEDGSFDTDTTDEDSSSHDEKKDPENEEETKFVKPVMTRLASTNVYGGEGFELGDEDLFAVAAQMKAEEAKKMREMYNPWTSTDEDFSGIEFDFQVIGTSAEDENAQPHVLSPPLMHSLQEYLPFNKRGESFWLKYSLVRDGASSNTFRQNLRGATHSVMAMETIDGEVFGAFTCAPWRIDHDCFGTGESFVWKMKSSRADSARSVVELAAMESEIDVFKYSYENRSSQLCHHDRIAVGGGTADTPRQLGSSTIMPHEWGFAISFDGDYLLEACTSPCITFNSPALSKLHPDGSKVELVNLEVWVLTPCISVQEATKMEMKKLFLESNS